MSYSRTQYSAVAAKRKEKKCATHIRQILTTTNPEILFSCPRPGGFVSVTPGAQSSAPSRNSYKFHASVGSAESVFSLCTQRTANPCLKDSFNINPSTSHLTTESYYVGCREDAINRALKDPVWDTILTNGELEFETTGTLADNMLAVTISCVMLMASKVSKIPEEYFIWTERYLSCIKDELDNHPPNIQGILNYIRFLRTKKPSKDTSRTSLKKTDSTITHQVKSKSRQRSNIPVSTRNSTRSSTRHCECHN